MQKFSLILLSFCWLSSTAAAQPGGFQSTGGHTSAQPMLDSLMRELAARQADGLRSQADAAKRQEAQYQERQFIERVNRFVQVWSRFVAEYNDKKAFDFKSAKELSKTFHELENSGYWPIVKSK